MGLSEVGERYGFGECLRQCRESRKMVLLIVAIALLLDNMLLSTVVPIIPQFLYELKQKQQHANAKNTSINPASPQDGSMYNQNISGPIFLNSNESEAYLRGPPYSSLKCIKLQDKKSGESDMTTTDQQTSTTTDINAVTTLSAAQEKQRHNDLVDENVEVGILFSSKAMVQVLTNPFVGPLTNRVGYSVPMFAGFIIMFVSTVVFAFGENYAVLFVARALQGMGSSCSSVAGMGMLADRYPDDQERGNAMAIALGGLALGVLIGPTFGSVMYEFVGKSAPFLVLAGVALFDGLLQLVVLQPTVQRQNQQGASLLTLMKDKYILIAAGSIAFANMGIAALEPSLPLWMMDTMNPPKWQLGAAFLPASIAYLVGTNIFGPLAYKMGRWRAGLIGLIIIGLCLICVPLAKNINHLIIPNAGLGFAIGMVDSSMMPTLGNLVDLRHAAVYGSVYAIGDASFCVGYVLGPIFSSSILKVMGFGGMLTGIALICFLYSPLMVYLKNPPTKAENKSLILDDSKVKYQSYHNEEE